MVKLRLKKSAPECPFECGGGGVNAIWAMPTWGGGQVERGFPNSCQLFKAPTQSHSVNKMSLIDHNCILNHNLKSPIPGASDNEKPTVWVSPSAWTKANPT